MIRQSRTTHHNHLQSRTLQRPLESKRRGGATLRRRSQPIAVWARVFGLTATTTPESASSAATKVLRRLEDKKLITRERSGRERKIRVTLMREDCSGKPYTRPLGDTVTERYLSLSNRYWLEGWHTRLDLPATAMLLVSLHEPSQFVLPTERVPEWYGWSADTAERGLATLNELGIITTTSRLKKAPLSPLGQTKINQYTLDPSWTTSARSTRPSTKRKKKS